MSQAYIQLLGSDTPQGYGGCCFYGTVEHAALQSSEPEATSAPTSGSDGYLFFNCPEGSQRFSSEANIKLTKIKGFFFTRWGSRAGSNRRYTTNEKFVLDTNSHYALSAGAVSAVMGLPGLLFTINDAGVEQANFFGPSDTPSEDEHESVGSADDDGSGGGGGAVLDEDIKQSCGGLRLFLGALRHHYFTYRRMSFRLLVPQCRQATPCTTSATGVACVTPLHEMTASRKPRDELYLLPPHNAALQSTSPSQMPFIVTTILINAQTLLVAFRVSSLSSVVVAAAGGTKMADVSAGDVFGYAVVTTTGPRFDPQRARALGVAPGPAYSVLKQGHSVSVETEVMGTTSRVVRAQDVMQDTLGNHFLFVSLVLDGDTVADVRTAIERLLGTNESQGGEGALQHILRTEQPQLWFTGATTDSTADTTRREARQVVVHQVVHLQPAHYFANAALADRQTRLGSGGEASSQQARGLYASYLHEVFSCVSSTVVLTMTPSMLVRPTAEDDIADTSARALLRLQRQQASAGAAEDDGDKATVTRHLFTSLAAHHFSAFPTALTHRYHLNRVAPTLFPIVASITNDAVGELWPYAFKFRCIPDCASAAWPAVLQDTSSRAAGRWGAVGGATSVLRYPDKTSACALLSTHFVQQLAAAAIAAPCGTKCNAEHEASSALSFLGTGSAVPGKYRNVSGTCLELQLPSYCLGRSHDTTRSRAVVVLDFGEGSLGQLAALVAATDPVKDNNGVGCRDRNTLVDTDHAMHDDLTTQFGYNAALCAYVRDIVLVFISHGHADHHLGLCSLLALRHECRRHETAANVEFEPLLVLCPREVLEFVRDTWGATAPYADWLWTECTFEVIDAAPRYPPPLPSDKNIADTAPDETAELPMLQARLSRWNCAIAATMRDAQGIVPGAHDEVWAAAVCAADHPAGAHALFLRFPTVLVAGYDDGTETPTRSVSARTLFFSGDTRPSEALIRRCHDFCAMTPLFLCLHEATFGPGYEVEASRKKHSTLPEAIEVGRRMGAEYVVLNHFSQRYPKLPGLTAEQLGGSEVDLQCKRRGMVRKDASPAAQVDHARASSVNSSTPLPYERTSNVCFAFDFMRLDFTELVRGTPSALTPMFVRLLEEYESWGTGTTKRLRQIL